MMDEAKVQWAFQLRVYMSKALAEVARANDRSEAVAPLTEILDKHDATMLSQLDAFEAYVRQAEREGRESFPLYAWTKATIEDPDKRRKHATSFALRVGGREVYSREIADALEADLRQLVGGDVVERISRHDTNPANNIPVPREYRG